NEQLASADFILILDNDVPWIPLVNKPSKECKIFHIDIDPLKENIPMWYIPSDGFFKADTCIALGQLNDYFERNQLVDSKTVSNRYSQVSKIHESLKTEWENKEKP